MISDEVKAFLDKLTELEANLSSQLQSVGITKTEEDTALKEIESKKAELTVREDAVAVREAKIANIDSYEADLVQLKQDRADFEKFRTEETAKLDTLAKDLNAKEQTIVFSNGKLTDREAAVSEREKNYKAKIEQEFKDKLQKSFQ